MNNPVAVNKQPRRRTVSVGARYALDRKKLLEVLQARRDDDHLSDTVIAALDDFLVKHGLLSEDEAAA